MRPPKAGRLQAQIHRPCQLGTPGPKARVYPVIGSPVAWLGPGAMSLYGTAGVTGPDNLERHIRAGAFHTPRRSDRLAQPTDRALERRCARAPDTRHAAPRQADQETDSHGYCDRQPAAGTPAPAGPRCLPAQRVERPPGALLAAQPARRLAAFRRPRAGRARGRAEPVAIAGAKRADAVFRPPGDGLHVRPDSRRRLHGGAGRRRQHAAAHGGRPRLFDQGAAGGAAHRRVLARIGAGHQRHRHRHRRRQRAAGARWRALSGT